MAFIYEVNGQKVQFDKEPTDADIDEAAAAMGTTPKTKKKGMGDYAKEFGQATASLADTGINALTGTLDQGAYALARAAGRTPEQATQETTSPKDVIGRAFGVTNTPGYQNEASRQLGQAAGTVINEYAVQPITQATGLPEQDVGNMLGTLSMGAAPYVKPAMQAAGRGVQGAVQGTMDAGKGFARGLAYPGGASPESALLPIRPTYVPHEQVQSFMQGKTPASSLTEVPTAPLYQNDKFANWAYGMAPESSAGQKLVPAAGRGIEGYAEQLGSTYRQQPLNLLADIGGTMLTGIPAPITAARTAIPAMAARKLQQATNFEPNFAAQREAALQTEGRAGLQSQMPQQPLLPAPGPVAPTLFANQQGVVTGQNGTSVPQQLSSKGASTPKQMSMDLAASKLQPIAPQPMPVQQAQQPVLNQRQQQLKTQLETQGLPVNQPAPAAMPKQGPVAPTELPQAAKAAPEPTAQPVNDAVAKNSAMFNSMKAKRKADELTEKNVKFSPAPEYAITHTNRNKSVMFGTDTTTGKPIKLEANPNPNSLKDGEVYVTVYDVTKQSKPVQIKQFDVKGKVMESSKKAPDNVSQMLTDDQVFNTKAEWDKANMFNQLAGKRPVGGYREGDATIRHEINDYSMIPEEVRKHLPEISIVKRNSKGKRIE